VRSHGAGRGRNTSADGETDRGRSLLHTLGWSPRDAVGFVVGAFATIAILVNVLWMQSGSHPAPMFKKAPAAADAPAAAKPALAATESVPVARLRPAEPAATPGPAASKAAAPSAPSAPRTPGEIITDIQRELSRRGYYDGTVDGLYGPKTDGAIRDFEHAAGLKPSTEPNEALLQAILRAPAKAAKATPAPAPAPAVRPPMPVRNDTVLERPAPSRRVIALQRALADYGYGQLKPTGIIDAETQAAIERFERERKLPVTGQASDRVARELAAMTGRPLE
jgi:peptidoglycan hydrolase-like protein with peptidoglycan-binding domain